MIEFLLPAGLLAATGILVPVLLHLWRPPGRTVRLGSLRHLTKFPGRRARDLRWRDRLLLALRVALLLTLAALVAEPHWLRRRVGAQLWALRAPDAKLDTQTELEWNRLLAEGYEPRWLAPGFPGTDAKPVPARSAVVDAWSLLREAAARVPAGSKIALFAPPKIAWLRGARPEIAGVEVRWVATPVGESASHSLWIDPASVTSNGGGLRAAIGRSDPDSVRFSIWKIPGLPTQGKITDPVSHAEIELRTTDGPLAMRLAQATPGAWLPVISHRPVRISIVHGTERAEDARYVAAAARAAGEMNDRAVTVEVRKESAVKVLPESDWLFRLGASPLTAPQSAVLADDRVNVVADAPRDATEIRRASWFVASNDPYDLNSTRLLQRTEASPDASLVVWRDGFGDPLLTLARERRAERWQFSSRFSPEAGDWVTRGAFPSWLQSLLLGPADDAIGSVQDRRLADSRQIQPATANARQVVLPAASGQKRDLHLWTWLLLALLVALERGLSLSRPDPATGPRASIRSKPRDEALEAVR